MKKKVALVGHLGLRKPLLTKQFVRGIFNTYQENTIASDNFIITSVYKGANDEDVFMDLTKAML